MDQRSPRLHKNLVAAVMEALETSFGKGYYADKVIERLLRANRKWGARDRGFIAETTYDMVRWWRWLWALYGKEPSLKRKELYRLFGVYWQWKGYPLPDWPQFDLVRELDLEHARQSLPDDIGLHQSFPEWLHQKALAELGTENWPAIAAALNQPAPLALRTNTLKIQRDELQNRLAAEGIETEKAQRSDVGLFCRERSNTFRLPSFAEGLFEVQDTGSQCIAPFLAPQPGERVIDACAGAGGKSLHLAALMQNKGSLIALDVEGRKLNELKRRARRNGVHNIESRLIDSAKVIKRLADTADRLLLDVPCSGTGVIKRNPDTKWKLQPEHLEKVRSMQREILGQYPDMLRTGGKMVYATCSILPSENEEQVRWFLSQRPEFRLINEQRLAPGPENDGFYMALLAKM